MKRSVSVACPFHPMSLISLCISFLVELIKLFDYNRAPQTSRNLQIFSRLTERIGLRLDRCTYGLANACASQLVSTSQQPGQSWYQHSL